jgi:hypothetical protein
VRSVPAFQVASAVDVLTLGRYPRMPMCIKTRLVDTTASGQTTSGTLSTRQRHCTLHRLSQVITHRLAACAHTLPVAVALQVHNAVVR